MTIADRYRRLAAEFTDTVAAVPGDRWADPSPCEDWNARDVVRHMVDTHGLFRGLVGREAPNGPSVDDDPLGAWKAARDQVQSDLDEPALAGAGYEGYLGPTTFEQSIDRFLGLDLLVHHWDLARAAGLDDRMNPAEVHRALQETASFGDALRTPGVCKAAIEPPPDADEQTRLLMFLGRRP